VGSGPGSSDLAVDNLGASAHGAAAGAVSMEIEQEIAMLSARMRFAQEYRAAKGCKSLNTDIAVPSLRDREASSRSRARFSVKDVFARQRSFALSAFVSIEGVVRF